jgi:geranylgeranylglycerol-phosphate geranylgeranyltransferase
MQRPQPRCGWKETHDLPEVLFYFLAIEEERKGHEGVRPMKTSPKSSPFTPLIGYLQLVRPLNAVLSMVGVLIGYLLSWGGFYYTPSLVYGLLAVFCISGAGQAINDYFDYSIDAKRKANRPLVTGKVSKRNALAFAMALFVLGVVFASYLSQLSLYIAAFFALMLIAYSAVMLKIKFVGNVIVALGTAFTFIFGASLFTITPLVLLIALSAFLANWVREIVKDMEDMKEDRGHKQTLATLLKPHEVKVWAGVLLLVAVFSGYLPHFFGLSNTYYLLLVTLANLVFILAGTQFFDDKAGDASSMLKKGMMIALLAQLSLLA